MNEYELPLLDFGLARDCPYCIDSSGNICIGGGITPIIDAWTGEHVGDDEHYEFDMCERCQGSGRFEVVKV